MAEKILIIDDEPDFLKVTVIRLQKAGFEVEASSNGQQALELAQRTMPEIIILDVMMPGMDGMEVKSKLNESLLTASIPVIFLSGKTDTEAKLKGLGLGADDYITKPFDPQELIARIRLVLDKKHYYEKLSMTDGLTGLYNHAFFKKQLSLLFSIAKRYNKLFSLIMIDVNDFKKINDTYGHLVGDQVLKEFSSLARQTLRTSDIIARYGGDEFAILLPETGFGQAEIFMERLRTKIQKSAILIPDSDKKITFSISAGLVTYESTYKNEEDFLNSADKGLYQDKATK